MRIRILIAVVVVMLALAAPAFASNPTDNAYAGTGATQIHNTGTTEGTDSSASTLPFTGINVGVVGAIAVALVGTGFVLRRSTRARTD